MKRRISALLMSLIMVLGASGGFHAMAEDNTRVYQIDSVNGTRWADYLCVYKDRATTAQNEWGENVIVDADGKVVEKIPGGDQRGKDLAIPAGGMVVSGTGDIGKEMYASVEVGDNAYFDEYGMRVLFSKGVINPFYKETINFTGYNQIRYSKTLIVYNKSGERTGTNGYGYEACVDKNGVIISSGGNDSIVPEGGFVVSAIEPEDRAFLKAFFIVGAKCTVSNMTLTVEYNEEMLGATVKGELEDAYVELEAAKLEYRLVDFDTAKAELDKLAERKITTLAERDGTINMIKEVRRSLIETRDVETRAVWYVPLERNASQIEKTVKRMAELGINQLCLGVSNGYKTFLPLPEDMPFKQDTMVRKIDLLQEYIDNCKKYGIELVLSVSVFGANVDDNTKPEWLTVSNGKGESDIKFYSPANNEFREYFKKYVEFIIENYDIDGIQWDYIRYEGCYGGVDFGYDEASKKLFAETTGLSESVVDQIGAQLQAHPNWTAWTEFKIGLIDSMVEELSALVCEKRPDLYVTACIANDTTRDMYFQDSTTWLENNWVDGVYPMSYAQGIMASATEKFKGYITDSTYLVMGNGAYLSYTLDEMYLQARDSALYGADGIAFFEWGAYVDHQYGEAFAESIYKNKAISFTANESEAIKLLVKRAEERFATFVGETEAFNDTSDISALKDSLIAKYPYDEKLYQDIDLALRIERFSREEYKSAYEGVNKGEGDADETTDEATSEGESVGSSDEKGGFSWWAVFVSLGAAVVVLAIILVLKRKK
ncbi:MAG: family 10 glycosylhydrolase [Clostridia bacterium]|nr:family 10 glycosylhydrolase [Clostridia bacterium]